MSALVVGDTGNYSRSGFYPTAFPDGSSRISPTLSASNYKDFKNYQEGFFELERSGPVQYTASMPDFQVFLMSDTIDDERKRLPSNDYALGYDHVVVENKRNTKSPTMGYSSEAPARLNSPQRFLNPFRQRAVSLSILEGSCEAFVTLENTSIPLFDLPNLVSRADTGLKYGIDPTLAEGAMGGTYFLRDKGRLITVVCKPGDEEPNSPNNPYQDLNGFLGSSYKGRIVPGFGMYREVGAFILDNGFAGVPPTALAKVRHRFLRNESPSSLYPHSNLEFEAAGKGEGTEGTGAGNFYGGYKLSSVQSYVRHEGCADDMGPCMFEEDDILRIAVLDIRLCNLDRHGGNILVSAHQPYVRAAYRTMFPQLSPTISLLSNRMCAFVEDERERFSEKDRGGRDREEKESSGSGKGRFSPLPSKSPSFIAPNCPLDFSDFSTACSAPNLSTSLELFFTRSHTPPRSPHPAHSTPTTPPLQYTTPVRSEVHSPRLVPKARLVPIDHGYCLPHILHMSDTAFIWLNWPQTRGPVPDHIRAYIASLDYNADVALLRRNVGAAIPETSLLTLRVCTLLLQIGVTQGLSLFDIGTAMSPSTSPLPIPIPSSSSSSSFSPSPRTCPCPSGVVQGLGSDQFSPLHQAVCSAVQAVIFIDRQTVSHCPHNRHKIRNIAVSPRPSPLQPLSPVPRNATMPNTPLSPSPSPSPSTSTSPLNPNSSPPPLHPFFYIPDMIASNTTSSTTSNTTSSTASPKNADIIINSTLSKLESSLENRMANSASFPTNSSVGSVPAPVSVNKNKDIKEVEILKNRVARSIILIDPSVLEGNELGEGSEFDEINDNSKNKNLNSKDDNKNKSDKKYDDNNNDINNNNNNDNESILYSSYTDNCTENSMIQRGKSCPIPTSPRGIPRFPFNFNLASHSRDRDTLGIASYGSARTLLTPSNNILVNDESLGVAISIQNGKLLTSELEKSIRILVEKILNEKKKEK